jgi:chromosome segregation ATPase
LTSISIDSFAERELALTMREADVARREHELESPGERPDDASLAERERALALREAEIARREREVELSREALETQRARLDAVRFEYEARRDGITARARELDAERDRLRDRSAQLVATGMEIEQRERAVASAEAALVEQLPAPPAPVDPTDEGGDWWAKQLNGATAAALH